VSPITVASNQFVADHLASAAELGRRLGDLVGDPVEFTAALTRGFQQLADPTVIEGIHSVTPGLGLVLGVRIPLMSATHRAFVRSSKKAPSVLLLDVVDRLLREEPREIRWFGMFNLGRLLPTDPERTWQLLRRAAAEADEWISVDTLAHPYGEGIVRDQRRWAEIEQLVYSPSRWERRLVGSTIATMPHTRLPGSRDAAVVRHGLALMDQLIGDDEPDVQKALSWALRTLADLDRAATTAFLEAQAETAARTSDGHRAWVIRDSASKLSPEDALRLKTKLERVRRRPGVPSTSTAASTAAGFFAGTFGTAAHAREE
jgi:3-methyladenine DNA glycosylase AlkD